MADPIGELARAVERSDKIVVFTGAGVSTESGLSDFRSPGGAWSRYDPEDFHIDRFLASKEARMRNWQFRKEFVETASKPNPAHYAIAELERMGKLLGVITQNIDGLHHAAGNSEEKIVELHGTMNYAKCLSCDDRLPLLDVLRRIEEGDEDPHCERCGGLLKAATVSFGEALPAAALERAHELSISCDLFVVVGSSLVVYPAAGMPPLAKRSGAKLAIVNDAATEMDSLADILVRGKAGQTLAAVMKELGRAPASEE